MLTINDIQDFKVVRRKLVLPKPQGKVGNIIFLPYLSPDQCLDTIKNSTLFSRLSYWKLIYREYRYAFRLFNKPIRKVNLRARNEILDQYSEKNRSLKGIRNILLAKGRNCYIDLSMYMEIFFSFKKKTWKLILNQFFDFLSVILSKDEYKEGFDKRILFLNINEWKIDKKDVTTKYNLLNNPFTILYLALKKDHELVKKLGDIEIIITDGNSGFFKFNPKLVDKYSYLDFKMCIMKIKSDSIDKDLDNDNHLNEYGAISSNAPEEELKAAKNEISVFGKLNVEDKNIAASLLDDIKELSDKKRSDISDDGYEDEEDRESESDSDEEDNLAFRLGDVGEEEPPSEEEEEEAPENETDASDLEREFKKEFNVSSATAKEIQDFLANKVPDNDLSPREKILKERQKEIKIAEDKSLAEVLDSEKINPSLMNLPVIDVNDKVEILNKSLAKSEFGEFEKKYNEDVFEHDFYAIFDSLSKKKDLPLYIKSIKKEDSSDSLNLKDTYHIQLEDPKYNNLMTVTIDVPKFLEGKFMYLNGNKKMFVKQLILKPVVKIAPGTVQICSNYKKIFMYRKDENVSPKVQNASKVLSNDRKYFDIVKGNAVPLNKLWKTSIEYDSLAKMFLSIHIKNSPVTFMFSQPDVEKYIEEHGLEEVIKGVDLNSSLIIGFDESDKKKPVPIYTMTDDAATVAVDFNNGEDIDPEAGDDYRTIVDTIFDYAAKYNKSLEVNKLLGEYGVKISKRYIYSYCKVMKKAIPTIFFLSYFDGLTTVMRKARIKYTFQAERPKFKSNTEKLDRGVIQFADGYLIFDRYPIENSLLMNAFSMIDTKAYDFEDMDRKDTYLDIILMLYNNRAIASAFDSFYDNMIDPITKELLHSMNYPEEFVELLIYANNLLADNNYVSEINMNNFRIRSNEMVNDVLYGLISDAYSNYKRTAANRKPKKLSIPKSSLIVALSTSQSVEDYSTLNPVLEMEKSGAVTKKGVCGVNLDKSYTEEKRSFDDTMIGLFAIATSPDANCGVVRQLSVNPKIVSPRGFIDTAKPVDAMSEDQLFSPSEMLTPIGAHMDDSTRSSMAFKQNKAEIPVYRMDPVLISNGAEKIAAYRLSSDFSIIAKYDGTIKEYDEANGLIVVEYNLPDGKTSHEVININPQITKNGGGGFFLANKLKCYFKPGDRFKAKDILAANDKFFGSYTDGIKYNLGTLCKVACMSAYNTFEDSTVVSQRLSNKMASEITMEKHLVLGKNANIISFPKIGQTIEVNQPIVEYEQSSGDEAINKLLSNLNDELKEKVTSLSRGVLRSKYTGIISDIKIYSVSELEELSPSLQKIVSEYWDGIKKKKDVLTKYNISDPSSSGNIFKLEDKPVKPAANGKVKGFDISEGVLIFIYITYHNPFSVGDKLINYSSLKGVTSEIMPIGKEPFSEFRPDEEISSFFPPAGLIARKVPSVLPVMFGNKVLIELKRKLGDMYLGHYDYTKDFDGHIDQVPDKEKNY